jgi:hypothetical protein
MRWTTPWIALALAASPLMAQQAGIGVAEAGVEAEPTRVVHAAVFFDRGQDPAVIQKALTDLVQRAATRLQAEHASMDAPLVETMHHEGRHSGSVDFVDLGVTMPAEMSLPDLLRALGADEACSQGTSCGDSCPRLDELGTGGHWHLLPDAGRSCLVTFFSDTAAVDEAKRLVLRHPRRYGLGRETPDGKARVTVGRPPWPPPIDKQP